MGEVAVQRGRAWPGRSKHYWFKHQSLLLSVPLQCRSFEVYIFEKNHPQMDMLVIVTVDAGILKTIAKLSS